MVEAWPILVLLIAPASPRAWAAAIDLTPPQTYTGPSWVQFSGTVKASGTNMTIWLDGQTGGTGQFKAECFDAVTVACTDIPVPLRFESVAWVRQTQVQLVLSGKPGTNVTILRSSNLLDWVSFTNLLNTNGTLQVTDTPPTNAPQRFYRATSP